MKTEKPKLWGVKVRKDLVDMIDERKWESRTTRQAIVERMVRLSLWLFEAGRFEDLESEAGLLSE